MNLVDEGPVLAALLGISLGETDGKVPEGILERKQSCSKI